MFSGTKEYRTKPPVGVMLNPLHPLSQGLVGCWLFNEGAGSVAHDISGHGNHGTLKSMSPNAQSSGWGGSKFGGGLDFDNSNDYVDYGGVLEASKNFTIVSCCKITGSGVRTLASKRRSDAPWDGWQLRITNNTSIFAFVTYSGDDINITATVPDLSAITRPRTIALTVKNNVGQIYLDGDPVGSPATGTGSIITTNAILSVGSLNGASTFFGGTIDSTLIYERALSAAEHKQLHEDPFCNLLRVPVRYAPAAAGGLPIPVAMNYYRRRRVA